MAELTEGLPTAEQLRTDPTTREGLSAEQLLAAGLTATETQTIGKGFSEAFGEGRAKAFRATENLETDVFGNVVAKARPVDEFLSEQITDPKLARGAEFTATTQTVQPGETQAQVEIAPSTLVEGIDPITGLPQVSISEGTASTVGTEQVTGLEAPQVESQFTAPVDPLVAAQLELRKEATISGQLENLFGDFEDGKVPSWAIGAFNKATEEMAARGITASTISSGAITQAFLQSAVPIASAEANTYFQTDLANFNAEQQTNLTNFQARQQNMLTDTAIENASRQFNAASASQTQQFVSQLITSIKTQNADRLANMEQFNIAQSAQVQAINAGNFVQVEESNRQQDLAIQQFNSQIKQDREKFNTNMKFAIDQSNVMWQRSVNTANTAAINAANNANAQNMFNLSQSALNSITQEWRDEAAWAFEAAENQLDRDYNLAMAAGNREFYARNDGYNTGVAIGGLAVDALDALDIGIDDVVEFFGF